MYTIEQACEQYNLIVEQLGEKEALNALFQAMSLDDCEIYFNAIIRDYDLDY